MRVSNYHLAGEARNVGSEVAEANGSHVSSLNQITANDARREEQRDRQKPLDHTVRPNSGQTPGRYKPRASGIVCPVKSRFNGSSR